MQVTHKSIRALLIDELRNGPGTCIELAERLRERGNSVVDTSVHLALRHMADNDVVVETTADWVKNMTRAVCPEGGTITYELVEVAG